MFVDDYTAAIQFYCDFLSIFDLPDRDAAIRSDKVRLVFSNPSVPVALLLEPVSMGGDSIIGRQAGNRFFASFPVEDVDMVAARLTTESITHKVVDTPWGDRQLSVVDPLGNKIVLCEANKYREM